MNDIAPELSGRKSGRRTRKFVYQALCVLVAGITLVSCSSNKSGCSGCQGCPSFGQYFQVIFTALVQLFGGTQCHEFCNIKVQLYDAATGQNLTGVTASSQVDFDLKDGSTTYFSGVANVNSDGTFTFPVNPCFTSTSNINSLQVVPYGGTFKATHGCPAGQCRDWTLSSGSVSFQGLEGCTPVIRVPVTTGRPCRNC